MLTKNRIYFILSISAVCGAILLAGIYFIISNVVNAPQKAADLKNQFTTLKAQASGLEDFKANYKVYQPDLQKIDQLFVNSQDPVVFVEFLEKIGRAGVQISSPSPLQQALAEDLWPFFTVQISIKGTISEILKFTQKLEAGPYIVKIQNLEIKTADQKSQNVFNANLLIKVYGY